MPSSANAPTAVQSDGEDSSAPPSRSGYSSAGDEHIASVLSMSELQHASVGKTNDTPDRGAPSEPDSELDQRLDVRNAARRANRSGLEQLGLWQFVRPNRLARCSKDLGKAITRSLSRSSSWKESLSGVVVGPGAGIPIGPSPGSPRRSTPRTTPEYSLEDLRCLEDQACLEGPFEDLNDARSSDAGSAVLSARVQPVVRAPSPLLTMGVDTVVAESSSTSANTGPSRSSLGGRRSPRLTAQLSLAPIAQHIEDLKNAEETTANRLDATSAPCAAAPSEEVPSFTQAGGQSDSAPTFCTQSVPRVRWEMLSRLHYLGAGEFCTVRRDAIRTRSHQDFGQMSQTPGSSQVWGATLEGVKVAVKVLKEEHNANELALKDLESETRIMVGLHHRGVLRVLGVGETEGKPFLVLDRLKSALSKVLPRPADEVPYWERRSASKRWPLARALQCGLELAEALAYLHDEALPGFQLLHRDLKPDNIGFLADGKLVLFDFGLAKLWKLEPDDAPDALRKLTGQTGSARYMAPEVASSLPYGASAEVYSFSIILWQLCSHDRPYAGLDMASFTERVVQGNQRPPLKKAWPPQLRSLLQECWHAQPAMRPTMAAVCAQLRGLCKESLQHSV